MWEHDWDKLDDITEVIDEIIPRDALSGGHTMALTLYYKCKEGEKNKVYRLYKSLTVCTKIRYLSKRSCSGHNRKF